MKVHLLVMDFLYRSFSSDAPSTDELTIWIQLVVFHLSPVAVRRFFQSQFFDFLVLVRRKYRVTLVHQGSHYFSNLSCRGGGT